MGREQVSELLVAAALNGTRQIEGKFRADDGGLCAIGVLLDSLPGEWTMGSIMPMWYKPYGSTLVKNTFGLTHEEYVRISQMNDSGVDFLTIARKWENQDNA